MPITINDVAKAAGVSKSTVSRVVNNIPVVDMDTKRRVLEVIKELGYSPNDIARGLATKRTGTIGLIINDITNPFFPELARGVEDVMRAYNRNVFLCNTDGRPEREASYIQLLFQKRVDGIIFASVRIGTTDLSALAKRNMPFVLAGRELSGHDADLVIVDNVLGGYQATRHLLDLGHTRIAFIAGTQGVSASIDREKGYLKAMAEAGLAADQCQIEAGDFKQEGGYAAAKRLLQTEKVPTAIFAANDLMAIGALEAIFEAGLRVPEDISLVGFDDIPPASLHLVQLTTVAQPKYDIGAIAARLLLEKIESPQAQREPQRIILPPKLQIRKTSGFAPQ
ncbi:MAG: LacI family DNA-binding transcriptional regulator [Firmicutes bacterium]|nr:LacI family DNA-binding transcriptional regulator [Bacillota bacterium]